MPIFGQHLEVLIRDQYGCARGMNLCIFNLLGIERGGGTSCPIKLISLLIMFRT